MRSLALVSVALIVACGSLPAQTTTTIPPTTTTSTAITSTVPAVVGCPVDAAFVDRGVVTRMDQPTSDTNSLGLISWHVDEGCERFGIDFETTEGAPATTPPTVVVEFLESRQILRVWTDVDTSVVTDQLVETPLVDRLFVVRALDGGMFVDFHLAAPAQTRVAISNSPARLSLDLQTGLESFTTRALVSDRVVVVAPADGAEAATTVDVAGYARTFEANVLIIATAAGEVVVETNVTAADWIEAWGEFGASIQAPIGEASLFVGEESPEDGRLTGVTINLTVR
jgi:hypothetical protein